MSMGPRNMSISGAVDLGALTARSAPPSSAAQAAGAGGGAGGGVVVDVTEATFATEVLERSQTVPVVIDFWAEWCGPCKQLSPILERLAAADAGRWVLAKIDVDANPRLAQAAQVQGIPAVKAVVQGQVVGEFTGAAPEREVRGWLDQLLEMASGVGPVADAGAPAADPGFVEAGQALDRGDLDAAAAAYRSVLERAPGDPAATAGLAQVELVARARGADPAAVREAAAQRPTDVAAQAAAADQELLAGDVDAAFGRLLAVVRATAGDERAAARDHLLQLFAALGPDDARVLRARRELTSALF